MTGSRATAGAALLALVGSGWAVPAHASAGSGPSTTSLVLSTTESAYGETVTASATVTTAPGPAQGDLVFAVGDQRFKANLGASGSASIVLPKLSVGQHPVSATFVPQLPAEQQGSTSPAQSWVVSPVRTRLQVRVIGRGARIPTSVEVKAAGEFGTLPTGRVKVRTQRAGTRVSTRVVQRLSTAGVVRAGLGRLPRGTYRLVVTYVGDSQHRREIHSGRFFVRRR